MAAPVEETFHIRSLLDAANNLNSILLKSPTPQSAEGKGSLDTCRHRCDVLLTKCTETTAVTADTTKDCLQEYAQILLDFTFIHENELVDENFPETSTSSRIAKILGYFDSLLDLAKEVFPNIQPMESLGVELMECVLWRKGALFYMYCHQTWPDTDRLCRNKTNFQQNLRDGVTYLQEMLAVRRPLPADQCSGRDEDDTFTLMKSGIYSDTHLLALMYAGEMCYWFVKGQKEEGFESMADFQAKDTGTRLLKSYIEAIKGPLQGAGWNTDRAQQILRYFDD
ncbi:RAB7A-interacting MON1-CCZ1 complex subunit 1-like isoform X1 [Haliotis rufescens]|uniref:RAB7A-interacting MON1-CCZ1 complex subunit 1-like isoform X1 n=1 Tax=Haliotis rufescens TaxID=6454 RepID=UPI001EB03116|nr:RAB7A-interacting MON1-CCZ1 complex subunit 1-like isoform X1 [Haliotis rufescens]